MPALNRRVGVAVDLCGCPNRCRHCYLGIAPNRKLPREVLREVATAFWSWTRPGEKEPYFEQVDVSSWYREPDFSDDYQELYELQRELSRRDPRRYELLSIWRLARDQGYATWEKEHGPRTCQITFFGMEKLNDYFFRRRGAFRDNLIATQRLLEVGMIPRWQIIITKPGLSDLEGLMELVDSLRLSEKVADLGGAFDMFCHPPGPDGEAWHLEDVRIERSELGLIPDSLMVPTKKHFGGSIDWEGESVLVEEVLRGKTVPPYVPEETWFFINAKYEVFSNYGELTPGWCLGNFKKDSLDVIFEKFEKDATPGLWASFHIPDAELAERFGRKGCERLYSPGDLKTRWVKLYGQARDRGTSSEGR